MAIDSAAKRKNTVRIMLMPLFLGLNTDGSVDENDRENAGRGYIGFDYSPDVVAGIRSRFRIGCGVGLGL